MKLDVFVHWVNEVKDIINDPGNDSLEILFLQNAFHRVSLSGRRHAVGEDGPVEAIEHVWRNQ